MITSFDSPTFRRFSAVWNAAVVLLVLVGLFVVYNWDQSAGSLEEFLSLRISIKNLFVASLCLLGGGSAFYWFGFTKPTAQGTLFKELCKVTGACTVTWVIAFLFALTSEASAPHPRISFTFLPIAIGICLCGRLVVRAGAKHILRRLNQSRNLIIVGSGVRAQRLYSQLRKSDPHTFHVLGFVDSTDGRQVSEEIRQKLVGSLNQLEEILMRQPVDEVLITLPAESCYAEVQTAITTCERAGVEAKCFFADLFTLSVARPRLEPNGDASLLSMTVVHDDSRVAVKRAIDFVGALTGLVLLSPLMLAVALATKLTSRGPAVFVQERYGFRKRKFLMFKFRTMVVDAERQQAELEGLNEVKGPTFKIRNDPRVTPLGRFLRKTSLDELPQLFNVLRGEMSLVGPRPLPVRDVSRFDNGALMRRFSVKPGLTCLWQVSGRSNTDFDNWIKLDLQYIDQWSLGLDLKILCMTVPAILKTRGAF